MAYAKPGTNEPETDMQQPDDNGNAVSTDKNSPLDSEQWADWPCCPQCGRRRQTRCSTCDLGGDDFPLAEFLPVAEALPVKEGCGSCSQTERSRQSTADRDFGLLLMCPNCEEAFSPTYYRVCQQCGHDFGEGWQVPTHDADPTNDRALLVLGALIAIGIAMLAYFWYLFS
jgi:hypothetical protein